MRRFLLCVSVALLPGTGLAQEFEAGLAIYGAGGFATAIRKWVPLATLRSSKSPQIFDLLEKMLG
jgi:hypothetical protein